MLRSGDHLAPLQTKCYDQPPSAPANEMLRSGDHLAPLPTKTNSPTATTRRWGNNWQPPPQESRCCNAAATRHRIAAMGYCCNAPAHCGNARIAAIPQGIAAMPVLLQCLSVLPQCLFQCSYCRNVAAMLMLLAMPFSIAAIRIAAILKRIAATPQYFPDVKFTCRLSLHCIAISRAKCFARPWLRQTLSSLLGCVCTPLP